MGILDLLGRKARSGRVAPAQPLQQPWTLGHREDASAEDIFYCFRLLLGRSPNPEEWPGHSGHAGSALDSVVASYLNSLEFARRFAALRADASDDDIRWRRLEGFGIHVRESDLAVGRHIQDGGSYEPHVTRVFRDLLKPGMGVLDVGANIGYFTMLAASLVGPCGNVLAIEPNAANVKLLEASRRENGFEAVVVVQAAAGRETGLLMLNTSWSNGTTASLDPSSGMKSLLEATTVPALRIDDLAGDRRIDLLKIDVEGAEYDALLGARRLLERWHPTIVSEFSPDQMRGLSGIDGERYLGLLLDLGYTLAVIEPDGSVIDCGRDSLRIMAAYRDCGVDHIDLLAR